MIPGEGHRERTLEEGLNEMAPREGTRELTPQARGPGTDNVLDPQ